MVDLPAPIEGGSGSGLEAIEQMMLLFEFPPTEDVGQLYSYRLNSRAAVLGTRRWQPFGGQNVTIGVQQTGSGMYMCLAANANERSMQTVTIRVQGTDIDQLCVHMIAPLFMYNYLHLVQQFEQMFLWLISQLPLREDLGQDLRPLSK